MGVPKLLWRSVSNWNTVPHTPRISLIWLKLAFLNYDWCTLHVFLRTKNHNNAWVVQRHCNKLPLLYCYLGLKSPPSMNPKGGGKHEKDSSSLKLNKRRETVSSFCKQERKSCASHKGNTNRREKHFSYTGMKNSYFILSFPFPF